MSRTLVAFLMLGCSCLAMAGVEWQASANGIERLVYSLGGGKRNLVDEGRNLGTMIVKGESGGKTFRLDTAKNRGRVTEASANRWRREWLLESGLEFRERITCEGKGAGTRDACPYRDEEYQEVRWSFTFRNASAAPMTVTDFGLQLPLGNTTKKLSARYNLNRQFSVTGYGSWFYWVQYDGEGECLVMLPDEKTPIEYFTEADWLYVHCATLPDPKLSWRIPLTRLELAPGATKEYAFTFFTAKNQASVSDAIYAHGGVNVRVAPGMTIPRGEPVQVAVRAKCLSGADGFKIIKVTFDRLGENRFTVELGPGRAMHLDFFVTEDLETVIKKRSAFIVKRQQHRDPAKWYNGLYSVFDLQRGRLLSPDDLGGLRDRYIVGGSDDPSNCKPLYLSEKNVVHPNAEEIASLEYYEKNFVWGKLQRTDQERPYPCGLYGCDNWYECRSGRAGDYGSNGSGRERLWRTYDYPTHFAIYYNLYRIAKANPSLVHYLDAQGYLERAYLTAMAFFEVPYSIKMGKQFYIKGWSDWAYKLGNFHDRYILDILAALEEHGHQEQANRLRREWEKKVTYMIYENPWPYGSEMFVDRTAFESSYYLCEYALTRAMIPQKDFWYDKNLGKWYSYTAYPEATKRAAMHNQLIANLAIRGLDGTAYSRCGTAWTGSVNAGLDYMTQMGGVALLDYTMRFAEAGRQSELLRWGYNSLLASWALVNSGDAASGYGYWRKGKEFDGAAGWCFQGYPAGKSYYHYLSFPRGPWKIDGEIDHGFTGGIHGSGCYVATDPLFGEIAYGGKLEGDAEVWRVTPWDGVRQYLAFPQSRLELRLGNHAFAKGKSIMIARDLSHFTLPLERRSETDQVLVEFCNLPKGDWVAVVEDRPHMKFHSDGKRAVIRFPFAASVTIRNAKT